MLLCMHWKLVQVYGTLTYTQFCIGMLHHLASVNVKKVAALCLCLSYVLLHICTVLVIYKKKSPQDASLRVIRVGRGNQYASVNVLTAFTPG